MRDEGDEFAKLFPEGRSTNSERGGFLQLGWEG